MVWHSETTPTGIEASFQRDLWRDLERVSFDEFREPQHVPEVVRGVASFMHDQSASRAIAASEWRCWLAKALWVAGEGETASALLCLDAYGHATRQTLQALCACPSVDPVCWQATLRGLLRHHPQWATSPCHPFWVIDLTRLLDDDDVLELAQVRLIRQLLHALAPVWDPTAGEGTLGVYLPKNLYPRSRRNRRQDWGAWLQTALCCEKQKRGWMEAPSIQRLGE